MNADNRPTGQRVLLFVYGTLRRGYHHPLARRLFRHAHHLGGGRVRGRLYRIGHYPGLFPPERADEWVSGDLYDLSGAPALFKTLDRYEGLGQGRRRPEEYVRVLTTVWLADGSTCEAWVYLYKKEPHRLPRIFSGDFLRERRR